MTEQKVNERAQQLLKLLIQRYIRDGQPVGSKSLVEEANLNLSAATVRNVMAELEEMGYLVSPHTSAGRVPTIQGFRFFVDSLLAVKAIEEMNLNQYCTQLEAVSDQKALLNSVSNLLSGITQLASIVSLPRAEDKAVRHIEFLPLGHNRILVIIVFQDKEVQNRIIQTSHAYSASELQEVANYITTHFSGKMLQDLPGLILKAMREDRAHMQQLLQTVLDVAEKTFDLASQENIYDFMLTGQDTLFEHTDSSHMHSLQALFTAFAKKRSILHLLDQVIRTDGVQIFIGGESGYTMLDSYSMVAAPYTVKDQLAGVLGVIGPTRMEYERVIPIVDITAKILSASLKKSE